MFIYWRRSLGECNPAGNLPMSGPLWRWLCWLVMNPLGVLSTICLSYSLILSRNKELSPQYFAALTSRTFYQSWFLIFLHHLPQHSWESRKLPNWEYLANSLGRCAGGGLGGPGLGGLAGGLSECAGLVGRAQWFGPSEQKTPKIKTGHTYSYVKLNFRVGLFSCIFLFEAIFCCFFGILYLPFFTWEKRPK